MAEEHVARDRNIALLIDADNASPDSLDPVLTVLAELGTVNIRRAYGNWEKPGLKGWAKIVHLHAIEPQQQFDVTKGKSATDMKMLIDAMDLLYGGRVGGFGIMSSDSDFMPLAMRIRQDGLPVYGFGEAKTPLSFQNACTRFIDVGALRAANAEQQPDDRGSDDVDALQPFERGLRAAVRPWARRLCTAMDHGGVRQHHDGEADLQQPLESRMGLRAIGCRDGADRDKYRAGEQLT